MSVTSIENIETIETIAAPVRGVCIFSGQVPLPPGVNGSYRPGKDGRSIRATKALQQFKRDASLMLANMATTWRDWEAVKKIYESVTGPQHLHTPLFMRTKIYAKSFWYYDIDAFGKAVTDAAFERLDMGTHDNLVVDERTTKYIDRSNPRVEIALYCLLSSSEE